MRRLEDLVAASAERTPERCAIFDEDGAIAYGDLERRANRLARALIALGCRRGDRVAFAVPKSIDAIVCQIATLKAGAAYLPIDPAGPARRAAKILDACEPVCVIVGPASAAMIADATALTSARPRIVWMSADAPTRLAVDLRRADLDAFDPEPPAVARGEDDLAHILFTSGSTGDPKGVTITHANARAFVDWGVDFFGIDASDRVSGHSPLHFDLSTFDIFGAFSAGAELHPTPARLNLLANKLVDFMRARRLTQWFSTPSPLVLIAKADLVRQDDLPELKRLLWCGEVFPTPSLRTWMNRLPHVRFTNLYGPTEATIASTYHALDAAPAADDARVPIGRPCDGEDALVLGADMKPTPVGELGDLYLSGVGLSPGYWRDPAKTDAAFFEADLEDGPRRLYRTGDLAMRGEDGLLYFAGRKDAQVKTRGFRVELGEIEAAIGGLGLPMEAVVVSYPAGGFEGAAICCAFAPEPGLDVTPAELRLRLKDRLPSYMTPSRWRRFDALPRNANGKCDRVALRRLFEDASRTPAKELTT